MQGGRVAPLMSLISDSRARRDWRSRFWRELNGQPYGNHHDDEGPRPITTTYVTLNTAEFVRFRSRSAYS